MLYIPGDSIAVGQYQYVRNTLCVANVANNNGKDRKGLRLLGSNSIVVLQIRVRISEEAYFGSSLPFHRPRKWHRWHKRWSRSFYLSTVADRMPSNCGVTFPVTGRPFSA
jgi:hypothetical protein